MHRILKWLGSKPAVAIILRKVVELNFRKEKAAIREFLLPLKEGDAVLDIGCGTGEFAPLLPIAQYTGIDIDPKNIAYAKAHYPHQFEVADGTRLPFQDKSFSVALIVGVLHHLSDADCGKVLREMKRVLKPLGRVLIMEDTHSAQFLVRWLQSVDQGAHIRDFREWQTLISRHFSITASGTFTNGLACYSYFFINIP